jgi:hypothetical protein
MGTEMMNLGTERVVREFPEFIVTVAGISKVCL